MTLDISMCTGGGCPLRERCYRAQATPGKYQSYIGPQVDGHGECELFWPMEKENKT